MSKVNDSRIGSIEIRPEVTILSVLRHLNYKAWFAIAEFIDNAIQSSISNCDALSKNDGKDFKLVVDIRLDATKPGSLIISDNAAGISYEDFPRAFKAAQVPDVKTGLSEFGMGMKSAACWFAEKWSVRTKALNENTERTVSFDVKKIIEEKLELLDIQTREVEFSSHYTVVTLQNLHHLPQGRTVGKIKDHLASIYRVFLESKKIDIRFNGDSLIYSSPLVLSSKVFSAPGKVDSDSPEFEWKKSIDLDFGSGQRVTGFAALRRVGSTPLAGFALFRRNRLIVGSHDETYRPSFIFKNTNSYPYQRLFGELHIEGFEVSHTKDGFRWEEYEDIFLELLKEAIVSKPLDLLCQAENYRALPVRKSIEKVAQEATNVVAEYIESTIAPLIVEAREDPVTPAALPFELDPSPLQASERTICVDDGDWKWIITIKTSIDPIVNDWVSLSKLEKDNGDSGRTRRICLDVSLAHPFSSEFLGANNENIELFLRFATAICVSLLLTEDLISEPPQVVLHHLNSLLRGALRRKEI